MENDNLTANIQKLLNDPDGMAKIQSMAASLFGEEQKNIDTSSGGEMEMLANALKLMKNEENDERGQLLMALKPHLKAERQERVDKAVKLMRLLKLAPFLSDMDIFKL